MSLVVARPLFSQKWVDGLKGVPESAMVAEVAVFVIEGEPVYDPELDTWVETTTTFYLGKARVQPIRAVQIAESPGDTATIQGIRFQIPVSEIADDLRPNMRVNVTASPLNASLLAFDYVLHSVVDSSNPIERTLEAKLNQEIVNG